jgi:hypothetical protein
MLFYRKKKIKEAVVRTGEVLFKEAWDYMDANKGIKIDGAVKHLLKKYEPQLAQDSDILNLPEGEWFTIFLTTTWIVTRKELGLDASNSGKKEFDLAAAALKEYIEWRFDNPPGWMKT